jgi:MYXO-CTERM domain-containing protein
VPLVNNYGIDGDTGFTVGSLISLVSEDETDIDGDALTYRWVQVDGPVVGLDDPTAQRASFRPQIEGTYRFALRLDDGTSIGPPLVCGGDDSCPDGLDCVKGVCVVETEVEPLDNQVPLADAGENQQLRFQSPAVEVTLDGTGSSDPDERPNPLSFFWSLQSGPVAVDISDETSATPSVSLPIGGNYVFALQVSDGIAVSEIDTVEISLVGSGVNEAPIAEAGNNTAVEFEESATLDGSASSDPDGDALTFEWVQLEGPQVEISDQDQAQATFTAPASQTLLIFQLTVRDAFGGSDTDEVVIKVVSDASVENEAPIAEAGENQTVDSDVEVTLDGSASSDPNGDELSFVWTQIAGPGNVALEGADTVNPTFTARIGGTYVFELLVSDGLLESEPDTVTVDVVGLVNVNVAGVPGSPDGGCDCSVNQASPVQGPWWVFLGLALLVFGRRRSD